MTNGNILQQAAIQKGIITQSPLERALAGQPAFPPPQTVVPSAPTGAVFGGAGAVPSVLGGPAAVTPAPPPVSVVTRTQTEKGVLTRIRVAVQDQTTGKTSFLPLGAFAIRDRPAIRASAQAGGRIEFNPVATSGQRFVLVTPQPSLLGGAVAVPSAIAQPSPGRIDVRKITRGPTIRVTQKARVGTTPRIQPLLRGAAPGRPFPGGGVIGPAASFVTGFGVGVALAPFATVALAERAVRAGHLEAAREVRAGLGRGFTVDPFFTLGQLVGPSVLFGGPKLIGRVPVVSRAVGVQKITGVVPTEAGQAIFGRVALGGVAKAGRARAVSAVKLKTAAEVPQRAIIKRARLPTPKGPKKVFAPISAFGDASGIVRSLVEVPRRIPFRKPRRVIVEQPLKGLFEVGPEIVGKGAFEVRAGGFTGTLGIGRAARGFKGVGFAGTKPVKGGFLTQTAEQFTGLKFTGRTKSLIFTAAPKGKAIVDVPSGIVTRIPKRAPPSPPTITRAGVDVFGRQVQKVGVRAARRARQPRGPPLVPITGAVGRGAAGLFEQAQIGALRQAGALGPQFSSAQAFVTGTAAFVAQPGIRAAPGGLGVLISQPQVQRPVAQRQRQIQIIRERERARSRRIEREAEVLRRTPLIGVGLGFDMRPRAAPGTVTRVEQRVKPVEDVPRVQPLVEIPITVPTLRDFVGLRVPQVTIEKQVSKRAPPPTPPVFVTPFFPPAFPILIPPMGGAVRPRRRVREVRPVRRPSGRFQPSLIAIIAGIRAPKEPAFTTGIEIRPITPSFDIMKTFDLGEAFEPIKRKKAKKKKKR